MSKFTMVLSEKEMSLVAEALEFCADSPFPVGPFTPTEYDEVARLFDKRLHW